MLIKLLLLLASLAVSVSAQTQEQPEKVLPIRGFTGVNRLSGVFLQKPNDAVAAFNLDLSLLTGSLSKRLGIQSVDTLNGIDSIIAIGVANISDGRQYMAYVVDDSNAAYGSIRISKKNSFSMDSLTTIFSRFPVAQKPSFTLFRDELYITNENSRAIHYKNGRAFFYPQLAPGEPYILPLATAGNVNGTVRYVFTRVRSGFLYPDVGYVSQPIRARNQQVLLTGFPWMPPDSFINTTSASDTIEIWRSRGDVQPLDRLDSVWSTGLKVVLTQASDRFSVTVTDTMSEATLTLGIPMLISNNNLPAGGTSITSASVRPGRYGSPGWVKSDSGTYDHTASNGSGIWTQATKIMGWRWNATFYDTVRNVESDTSPGLVWLTKAAVGAGTIYFDSLRGISRRRAAIPKIVLPRSPDSVTQVRLYRTPILAVKLDTLATISTNVWGWICPSGRDCYQGWFAVKSYKLGTDSTTFGTPRLVGQYSSFDTVIDTLRYDSLVRRSPYLPEFASGLIGYQNGLVQLGSRLWSFQGNRVFFTSLDSATRFGALSSVAVNDGDGDIITAILPTEDGLSVYKSRSMYLVYPDGNGSFTRQKVAANIGCVAPRSLAKTARGTYFLSAEGVYRQTSGQLRDAAPQFEKVSEQLPQLARFTSSKKSKAVGIPLIDKYVISFGDTTYVYAENTGQWSTWEFGLQDAVKFAVEDNQTFLPLDSFYFLMSAEGATGGNSIGRRLWRYGSSEIDSGYQSDFAISDGPPTWYWKTVPLLVGAGYKSITKIGFYGSGGASDNFTCRLLDETGAQLAEVMVLGISGKYQEYAFPPTTAKYYQIELVSSGITSTGRTILDGMDVYYTETGSVEMK